MIRRRLFYLGSMALWAVVLAVIGKASLDQVSVPPWGNPASEESPLVVEGGGEVGEAFVAPFPGLYRITVTQAGIAASTPQAMTFHLTTDPQGGPDIWSSAIPSDGLQAGQPLSFEFLPLGDSAGQTYYFYLEAANPEPGTAIGLNYSADTNLDGAGAYLDGVPVAGNLQFQTFYALRTRDKLDVMLNRMASGRPYMFGSKMFYVGLGLAYVLVLLALVLQLVQSTLGKDEGEP
jgi:hypothetical protein